ncbi:amino acid adenylation domain-containing protein [Kitasatospora sp. NPDC093806]|uniref:non-ribosomal peptide synthetase n=1 Tax=Kitasatospora sp. NPDC093806 TaxID=3155075 RepID=UPI00342E737C
MQRTEAGTTTGSAAGAETGTAGTPASGPAGSPAGSPASSKERALWLLEDLVPGAGVNNLTFTFQTDGALDGDALRQALDALVRRHEVLRTAFRADHEDGSGLRRRTLPVEQAVVPLETVDPAPGTDVLAELTAFTGTPFQADGGVLLRARHVRLPGGDTPVGDQSEGEAVGGDVFCLVLHHTVYDGMSTTVVVEDFRDLYDALVAGEPVPERLAGQVPRWSEPEPTERSREFWQRQVDGLDVSGLDLGNDKPLPARTTLEGDWVTRRLAPEAAAVAKRLRRELRAPEVVVLLAAYYALLAAHGAGPDLTVGSPISTRGRDQQRQVGYHINVLTIRQSVAPELTFRELVTGLRRTFLDAIGHADFPVDELLEIVPRLDASWRNSLFRHVFNYVPQSDPRFAIGGGKARLLTVENGYSKFDLEFFVTELGDSLQIRAAFYRDAYDRADVELMVERYEALLLAVGEDPDQALGALSAWSPRDRAVIDGANATERTLPYASVLRAVADRVAERPEAVAVEEAGTTVSYRELWADAHAVADALRAAGAAPGDVVALLARRGAALASAVLGVWLAGGCYLPLDPDHPAQRLAYQLDDAGARFVLADAEATVPEAVPAEAVTAEGGAGAGGERTVLRLPLTAAGGARSEVPVPDPASCAYLIYTSGSTGRPKGTLISHHNLANLVAHFADELDCTPDTSALWMTTFSFDISALELFVPLACGGRVVVAPDDARVDGARLLEVLEQHAIDIVQATPTTWRLVVEQAGARLEGRRLLSGGEPLPPALARRLLATGGELRNVYGPTETTIWSASGRIADLDEGRLHVGGPIANTRIFVAGPRGDEAPIGLRGELCIAGEGVGIGYHERPELTADRFADHPRHGRHYRTGDVARWLPDGTLEVLGRMDRQVKLRGNRIELGEVEAVLLEHPGVGAAAVVLAGDPTTDGALVAFVVAPASRKVIDELWSHSRTLLQGAAVPQDFVLVDAFPMTGNDKVNHPELTRIAEARRARQAAEAASGAPGADVDANPLEEAGGTGDPVIDRLTVLWRELLGTPGLDADAHFFTSGGHSMLGAQLIQRIKRETGIRLKLAELFANPTPRTLADQVKARQG